MVMTCCLLEGVIHSGPLGSGEEAAGLPEDTPGEPASAIQIQFSGTDQIACSA